MASNGKERAKPRRMLGKWATTAKKDVYVTSPLAVDV